MVAWVDALIATVAHHARPLGITHFTETGRTGWRRFLAAKAGRRGHDESGQSDHGIGSDRMSTKKKTTSTQTNTAATWAQPSITSSLSGLDNASKVSSANAAAVQPALDAGREQRRERHLQPAES
jgi:hypothetical protein